MYYSYNFAAPKLAPYKINCAFKLQDEKKYFNFYQLDHCRGS